MSLKLPEPEKATQRASRRETQPASTHSFQAGLHPILQLQRTLGNRQVAQLIKAGRLTPEGRIIGGRIIALQPRLTVGAADDQYEQEADRVARQVVSMPDSAVLASSPQTSPVEGDTGQHHNLQSKPLSLAASITPFVQRQIGTGEESEESQDKEEDKEGMLQGKFFSRTAAFPLQRQSAAEGEKAEEAEPIQARSAGPLSDSFEAGDEVESRLNQSKGGGSQLPDTVRAYMEPRFGVDFSHVRVHTGSDAIQMNRDVGAQAFTHGSDIYYGAGSSPGNLELTAHELTHVVQQANGSSGERWSSSSHRRGPSESEADRVAGMIATGQPAIPIREPVAPLALQDAGASDAGTGSLPGGIPPTVQEVEEARLRDTSPAQLRDSDIGPAIEVAQRDGNQQRVNELINEFSIRGDDDHYGFAVGLPDVLPRGVGGRALVTPEIAMAMMENMLAGRPPFRPDLGRGGVSWFVTEGSPATGMSAGHTIPVQVDLIDTSRGLRFEQAQLDVLYAAEETAARPEVEVQVREQFRLRTGRDAPAQLSRALLDKVARQVRGLAERRMWIRVGEQVAASAAKVGEVILPAGGRFSMNPGRFTLVAEAASIRIRGGILALLDAIRTSPSVHPIPELEASAEELARTLRIAGRVRFAFRLAGKVLLVFAITATIYEICVAEDTLEAVIVSAAGWAGAIGAAATFSAFWTPADVAGPWAWAGHGVGVLVAGGIGYWIGSETTRYIYRLTIQNRAQVHSGPEGGF